MGNYKIKSGDKIYEYEYKTIFISPQTHKELKVMAVWEGMSIKDKFEDIFQEYKKNRK